MAVALQLEFDDLIDGNRSASKIELRALEKDFRLLDKKCQNVQRGLFARFGTVQEEMEHLRDLCYKMKMELDEIQGRDPQKAEILSFNVVQ